MLLEHDCINVEHKYNLCSEISGTNAHTENWYQVLLGENVKRWTNALLCSDEKYQQRLVYKRHRLFSSKSFAI